MSQISDRIVSHIDQILTAISATADTWKTYKREVQIHGDHAPDAQKVLIAAHTVLHDKVTSEIAAIGVICDAVQEVHLP